MASVQARLGALESKLNAGFITLHMPDGRQAQLPGDAALKLLGVAMRNDPTPEQAAQLALIAESESAVEPGDASMIELIRAILNSPYEE